MNSISSSSSARTEESIGRQKNLLLQKMAKFFFLMTLDEEKASVFSRRAANEFLHKINDRSQLLNEVSMVQICYFALKKIWPEQGREQSFQVSFEKGWFFKKPTDLSPWASFRRKADRDEFAAVLFLKVLKIPVDIVAQALNVTEGTLRLRLSRGLRALGPHLEVTQ
jgi:hypothetical protein